MFDKFNKFTTIQGFYVTMKSAGSKVEANLASCYRFNSCSKTDDTLVYKSGTE
jgi:hypothetical protein